MKENSILKIKVLSYREGNGGYISFDDTLKDYWERSSTISDFLDRFVFIDVMYVPFNSILFFSSQKDLLFFLKKAERFYYFEMVLTNGKKYFIPGKTEEVLPTLFDDLIIKD